MLFRSALTKFISPQVGTSVAFYFSGHPNFAANQSVTVMEIITFESKAYKELDNKITAIADYIFQHPAYLADLVEIASPDVGIGDSTRHPQAL